MAGAGGVCRGRAIVPFAVHLPSPIGIVRCFSQICAKREGVISSVYGARRVEERRVTYLEGSGGGLAVVLDLTAVVSRLTGVLAGPDIDASPGHGLLRPTRGLRTAITAIASLGRRRVCDVSKHTGTGFQVLRRRGRYSSVNPELEGARDVTKAMV